MAGLVRRPNLHRQPTGELEWSSDLRRLVRRVVLDKLDTLEDVALTLEMVRQARTDQVLGAGATPPAVAAGIIWNEEELDVHRVTRR